MLQQSITLEYSMCAQFFFDKWFEQGFHALLYYLIKMKTKTLIQANKINRNIIVIPFLFPM